MDMQTRLKKQTGALISLLIFFLLACDATLSVGYPTATIAPPTETPTVTPPSLKLTLISIPYSENNAKPPSMVTAQIPQLTGSEDPRVASFNQAVNDLVHAEIESFKRSLTGLSDPPQFASSTFDAQYDVIYQAGDLWSLKFDMNVYVDGAAHPGELSRALNYDFSHSQMLNLEDLFLADSNYLQVLSKLCSEELVTRDIGFDATTTGAEPIPENYRNWNITADGLMITFDRGQVAAYAAPAQIVVLPYNELTAIANPQGPLGGFVR